MNEFMFEGKMCLTDCGVENCAVRFVILLMKNVPNSPAVRVDERGGGGGQRHRTKKNIGQIQQDNTKELEVTLDSLTALATESKAVSVECSLLKPDWLRSRS